MRDKAWADFYHITTEKPNEEVDIGSFLAQIFCENYPQLLGQAEVSRLRALVARSKAGGSESLQAKAELKQSIFFGQLGRVDELGSGIRNVTIGLREYSPGKQAEFVEEDVFRTVIPVPDANGKRSLMRPWLFLNEQN